MNIQAIREHAQSVQRSQGTTAAAAYLRTEQLSLASALYLLVGEPASRRAVHKLGADAFRSLP